MVPHPRGSSRPPASLVVLLARLGEMRAAFSLMILVSLGSGSSRPAPQLWLPLATSGHLSLSKTKWKFSVSVSLATLHVPSSSLWLP